MKTRNPAVAGTFYPGSRSELIQLIESIYNEEMPNISREISPAQLIGGIVPHAGYIYSGYEAVHFFDMVKNYSETFDTFIIVNPNHSGYGSALALDSNDIWETPLGTVYVDKDFDDLLDIEVYPQAHTSEHSAEVMVPLLQYFIKYNYKILPISISHQTPEVAVKLANELYNANLELKKNILIIASSDFSHFVEPAYGKRMDDLVLQQIQEFNTEGVYHTVRSKNISVCGYGPIMTLMEYAKLVSKDPKIKILARGNSGKKGLSYDVVDYVSAVFYE